MNIRSKLTFRFSIIVAAIILLLSVAIYFFSADYRESTFYERLKSRGINTATLLNDVAEVDSNLLHIIDKNTSSTLVQEDVAIYNNLNQNIYCNCNNGLPLKFINNKIINRIWLNGEVRFQVDEMEVIGFIYKSNKDRFVVVVSAYDQFGIS